VYLYPYSHPFVFYNMSSNRNESKPVICACDETVECGCDDNSDNAFMTDIIGNGRYMPACSLIDSNPIAADKMLTSHTSYDALNKSLVTVAAVNGTSTILINGTLPNGTTANGGTDDPNAGAGMQVLLRGAGWWPVVATVLAMVLTV
jgi:hypothetical protein